MKKKPRKKKKKGFRRMPTNKCCLNCDEKVNCPVKKGRKRKSKELTIMRQQKKSSGFCHKWATIWNDETT